MSLGYPELSVLVEKDAVFTRIQGELDLSITYPCEGITFGTRTFSPIEGVGPFSVPLDWHILHLIGI